MKCISICIITVALMSSCTTYEAARNQQTMQAREDYLIVREDMNQLKGRQENTSIEIERLWDELQRLKQAQDTQSRNMVENLNKIEAQISRLETARAKDRQEIIDTLSKTIAEVVRKNQAARPSGGRISEYGVEHTVQPGQTLSEIAAAYGVKSTVIIEANNLRNPDRLNVGQKLFIPE